MEGSQRPGGPEGPFGPGAPGTPGLPASPASPFLPSLPMPGAPGAPEVEIGRVVCPLKCGGQESRDFARDIFIASVMQK